MSFPSLNDRDALLEAAPFRVVNAGQIKIVITPSAPAFHLNSASVPDVGTIDLTATLIGAVGAVTWGAQNGTITGISGTNNVNAQLRFIDITGPFATVTASITVGGVTYSTPLTLSIVKDGQNGSTVGAKVATLTPSAQVFKINKANVVDIASITLDATGQNTTGTPNFTILAGTATLAAGASASQKILTYANMTSDSVTVKITLDGQIDQVTIIKVREGLDGVSPVTGFLTNEAMTLPADSAGTVSAGTLAAQTGTFKVFEGATDKTGTSVAYSVFSETGVDVSITTAGAYSVVSMAADTGTAVLQAVYGGVTIQKTLTLAKAKSGVDGIARYVDVSTSGGQVFSRATAAAAFAPTSITLVATPYGGAATAHQWQYWDGSAWVDIAGATAATTAIASGAFTGSRVYRVQATIGGTVYTDEITLVQVTGGADGVSAVNGLLSNESVTLPADASGNVTSVAGAVCTLSIYQGITDTSGSWAYGFSPVSSASGLQYTTNTNTLTVTGLAAGVDAAYVDITATRTGYASVTKRFSVSKSKQGAQGSGTTGARGAGQYYAVGSAWSDTVADAATPGTGSVIGDQVTIADGAVTFTKRWDGSVWSVPGAYLSGSLFVPESITASMINTNGLKVRDTSGNIILDLGGLRTGFEAPNTKNSEVTLSTLGAPAAALSRVAIGTMHSGGNGNVRFAANQNVSGAANDGEIRVLGTTFYHPDGTKRTIIDAREISTPFEDVTTADPFFIIYTDTSPVTRFGTSGYTAIPASAISPNFFAAVYNLATGVWQAVDNANVRTTFTPLATDCIVAIGRKYTSNASGAGIDMLSSLLSVNTNLPADGATVNIKLVATGNITLTGNRAEKTLTNAWDSQVYSKDSYTGGAYASAVVETLGYSMVGLNTSSDLTDAGFASLDYAFYALGTGMLSVYESGSDKGQVSTYVAGDVLSVTYDGSVVRYLKNGLVLKTTTPATPITAPLFLDSSLNSVGVVLSNIQFGPMSNTADGTGALAAVNHATTGLAQRLNKNVNDVLGAEMLLNANGKISLGADASNRTTVAPAGIVSTKAGVVNYSQSATGDVDMRSLTVRSSVDGSVIFSSGQTLAEQTKTNPNTVPRLSGWPTARRFGGATLVLNPANALIGNGEYIDLPSASVYVGFESDPVGIPANTPYTVSFDVYCDSTRSVTVDLLGSNVDTPGITVTATTTSKRYRFTEQIAHADAPLARLRAWSNTTGGRAYVFNVKVEIGTKDTAYNDTVITPSNVGQFIQQNTIGNTQIGGDLYSTNWNFRTDALGTGWYLERATGTFYGHNVKLRGAVQGGAFDGWAWPSAGQVGYYLGSEGLLLGNLNDNRYLRADANGNLYMPGLTHENGQLTLTNTILISPQIAKIAGSFVSSPANSYYFTVGRNSVNAFAGAYELNLTAPDGTETFSFNAYMDNSAGSARVGGVNGKRANIYVTGNGYIGQTQVNLSCTVNRGGISSTFGISTTVEFQ